MTTNEAGRTFAELLEAESHRAARQRLLAGEIIARLRANLLRQTLTTQDDSQFEAMLDAWSERLEP